MAEVTDHYDGTVSLTYNHQAVELIRDGDMLRRVICCCDCGLVHLMSINPGTRMAYFVSERGPVAEEVRAKAIEAGQDFSVLRRLTESEAARLKAEGERDEAVRRVEELERRARLSIGTLPCGGCGGPHSYDTSVPSAVWNAVIRERGLSEYLCLKCVVREFARAERSFTAELYGDGLSGLPIEVRFGGKVALDAGVVSNENTALRVKLDAAEARLREVEQERDDWKRDAQLSRIHQSIEVRDGKPPASHEPHVFHNRLDEQQRKEGEQEPCALCGRMLDAAIHASHEPEASPRAHEFGAFAGRDDITS